MGLVYEKGVPAAPGEESLNVNHRVKEVVHVADHHVAQLRICQRKLVGAETVLIGHLKDILTVDDSLFKVKEGKCALGNFVECRAWAGLLRLSADMTHGAYLFLCRQN